MSDLQCPARFLVTTAAGLDASSLQSERVAALYATREVVASGRVVTTARELEVALRPIDDAARPTLATLADLHRGENVVVVTAGDDPGVRIVEVGGDA